MDQDSLQSNFNRIFDKLDEHGKIITALDTKVGLLFDNGQPGYLTRESNRLSAVDDRITKIEDRAKYYAGFIGAIGMVIGFAVNALGSKLAAIFHSLKF